MSLEDEVDLTDAAADAGISPRAEAEIPEPKPLRESLETAFAEAKERARDDRGRFTAAERELQDRERAAAAKAGTPDKGVAAAAAQPGTTQPPAISWKNPASAQRWETAEWLKTLPPEVRTKALADIAKREEEVHVGMTKQDEERSFGRDIQKAIAPYAAMIAAEGATPAQAVQSLLNTAYILRAGAPEQKAQALAAVAQQYGIPLDRLAPQSSGEGDPNAPWQKDIAELRAENQRLNSQLAAITNASQEQINSQVTADIQRFAADPKHVHFPKVQRLMGTLMTSGQATSMEQAYELACWADPETRSTLQAEANEKRAAEEREKADAAKRKAVSVRGGPGAHAPTPAGGSNSSLREQLRSALSEATGRV